MKKLSTNEIRNTWIDFWKSKGHYELESKSLIPHNDNSLLFINSGVATLKNYLSGKEIPPAKRIVNSQKSLRTNDIENVGITSRHHTMFEMLGNFSIGDYFKKEAIEYAWELLTSDKYYGLDKDKLYITVHPDDSDSYNYWLEVGVENNKIVKTEENFWEIGKGPGGPNTEIFYDRGQGYDQKDPRELLEKDLETNRVIEIWNIVFSQYNCNPEVDRKDYEELPQKNIDTGMGLERMACIMQDVETNFETDNFKIIMDRISQITKTKYNDDKKAYRIIADHIRALSFAISDGVDPSNEGRGYVVRRILRRAVKYAYIDLEIQEPFLYKLVEAVVKQMSEYYPELEENQKFIEEVILREEKRFLQTISDGVRHYNEYVKEIKSSKISGEVAFKLYDTYGFPLELTQELAQENNFNIDLEGYNKLLEEQKQRARSARKDISSIDSQNNFFKELKVQSEFIGYDYLNSSSQIVYITDGKKELESVQSGDDCFIILDKTPFYATSGGQEFDTGRCDEFEVVNVVKLPEGQHLHEVKVVKGIRVNDTVNVSVNRNRRKEIERYHSSTHLLHYALEKVLGDSVKQAGSNQDDKRTRFDYTTHQAPTTDELIQIQQIVNNYITKKVDVITKEMTLKEAKEYGAKAFFDDKYKEKVRVVTIGDSIELCGGTHVKNTKEIEKFLIVSEQSVGSGIRRIEALVGKNVVSYIEELLNKYNKEVQNIKYLLEKVEVPKFDNVKDLFSKIIEINEVIRIEKLPSEEDIKSLEKQAIEVENKLKSVQKEKNTILIDSLFQKAQLNENATNVIEGTVENVSGKTLKELSDKLMEKLSSGIVIISTISDDKISMVVKVSDDLVKQYHAGNILKEKLAPYNGRGGGKPTMAQGGGVITKK